MAGADIPKFNETIYEEAALGNPGPWPEAKLRKIPLFKQYIVEMHRQNFTKAECADALGISLDVISKWLKEDPSFQDALNEADEHRTDALEKEVFRRAKDGVLEPIVSNGRVVMDPQDATKPLMIRVFSDRLAEFLLKGKRRQIYGEKLQADVTHEFTESAALERFKSLLEAGDPPSSEA